MTAAQRGPFIYLNRPGPRVAKGKLTGKSGSLSAQTAMDGPALVFKQRPASLRTGRSNT